MASIGAISARGSRVLLASALAASAFVALPVGALVSVRSASEDAPAFVGLASRPRSQTSSAASPDRRAPGLVPYRGLGAWIDMYNKWPWDHPYKTVGAMKARGVNTLYLQTSNYHKRKDIFRPRALSAFLDAAARSGIHVVAWYVPSFGNMERDRRRTFRAIDFRTPRGNGFDAFALDIEAAEVGNLAVRNRRLFRLSAEIRRRVGKDYAIGAIVPEAGAVYWPGFPYKRTAPYYDVFLPMAYHTYRVAGATNVYRYIRHNIRTIRRAVPRAKIHVIGGIAGDASFSEIGAYFRAAKDHGSIGAGLYDWPLLNPGDHLQSRRFVGRS